MRKFSFLVALLVFCSSLPVFGQAQASCGFPLRNAEIDADLQACTGIIEAGQAGKVEMAAAHAYRAYLNSIKGNAAAADKDADAAIALDPDHAVAHIARAQVLFRKGSWDKSYWEISTAIKLDPNNDWAYNHRGIIDDDFARVGEGGTPVVGDIVVADPARWVARAISDFSQAIKLNPSGWNYYFNRASTLQRTRQFAQAVADADMLRTLDPDDSTSWNSACWARAVWGQELETALSACDKALVLATAEKPPLRQTTIASYLDSRCLVKFRMEKYAEAIEDCTAAIKNNPKLAGSLYIRGLALTKSGSRESGSGDLSAARQLNRNVEDNYARYGVKP